MPAVRTAAPSQPCRAQERLQVDADAAQRRRVDICPPAARQLQRRHGATSALDLGIGGGHPLLVDVPLAFFLTFRTYGTWPPGDDRGFVDHRRRATDAHESSPNPWLQEISLARMHGAPRVLNDAQRLDVDAEIRETCRRHGWDLHALNVRTNHVHIVLSAGEPPEQLLASLKAWATRRLRSDRLVGAEERVWARHGSTRCLRTVESLEAACDYVVNQQ